MFAWVDGCHLDVIAEVGEIFEGDSFVLVVTNDIFHHELWWKRLRVRKIAGKIEARSTVVRGVCDINSISSACSIQKFRFESRWKG